MRKYLYASMALVLAVVITGCGGGSGRAGSSASHEGAGSSKQYPEFHLGELVFGVANGSLNFKGDGWTQQGQIESLVVQRLVDIGPEGQPQLELASSVEHPNPTTYVYGVRKGIRFSDGKPLTVADVVYSLDLNKGKFSSVAKEPWEVVASVSARGDSTVVIKLKHPSPDWMAIMAGFSQVFEKAAAEKVSEEALGTPRGLMIGTGPWKFDSYTPESSIQLSSNPYWSGPPQPATKITITIFKSEATMALALRSGAIDAAATYESQKLFANIPGTHQLDGAQNQTTWVSMNTSAPPFNDVHVRRAIAYATDVNGIIQALYPSGGASKEPSIIPTPLLDGLGSTSEVSSMIGTLTKYEYNLAKAKEELAKSAYPHGFTTTAAACVAEPILLNVAQILAADLGKLGITVHVKGLQNDQCILEDEQKAMFVNEYPSFVPNEPDLMMETLLSPTDIYPAGTGTDWPKYRNAELGRLLPEVVNTPEAARRVQLAGKALGIAAAEEPYVPLFMHSTFMAVSNKFVSPALSFYTTTDAPWMLNMKLAN
ncbi:MAG TPA: ABC transporter substrate-binding protein [Solirubrobacteraceae bacterium]|nr:ABC transporter substrate-binding protein [Solirubrobacteraceae bacterium]